jgi:glutamine synthetase adenylyltransferase
MSRPPALAPAQQEEVRRRLAAGEGVRALAREYKVGDATIRRLAAHSARIRNVAEKLAEAQSALAELPPSQQHIALSLAEKLRSISDNLASAAEYGAKTAHRLHALANSEVAKIDDADPAASEDSFRTVGALTRLANDSAHVALNLLGSNRDSLKRRDEDAPVPSIEPGQLADATLDDLMRARGSTA